MYCFCLFKSAIIESLNLDVIDIVFSSVGNYYSVKTPDLDNKVVSAMNDKSQRSDDNKTQEDREVLPKNATD